MSRSLTAAMLSAMLGGSVKPVLFYEGEFAPGTLRLCTAARDLSWNGHTWLAAGQMLEISPVEEVSDVRAVNFTVALNGEFASILSDALGAVRQGLDGTVWIGAMEPGIIDFDFTKATLNAAIGAALASISFTRANTGTRVNAQGLVESVAANTPRFNYDPVTLVCKGLLIEEARTNPCVRSAEFDNAIWTKGTATISANALASPSGTTDADALIPNSGSVQPYVVQNINVANAAHVFSVFLKIGALGYPWHELAINDGVTTFRAWFNLSTGAKGTTVGGVTSHGIEAYGNGWYRCHMVCTLAADASAEHYIVTRDADGGLGSITGDGSTPSVYLWGGDVQEGNSILSHIPTTSTANTRFADVPSVSSIGGFFNAAEGTILAEWTRGTVNAANVLWSFNSGSSSERIVPYEHTSTPLLRLSIIDNGVPQVDLDKTLGASGVTHRSASAYKLNDCALSLDGGALSSDASATMPTVDRLHLGHELSNNFLNGHLRRLTYYPLRLPDADLQRLSSPGQGVMDIGRDRLIIDPFKAFAGRVDRPDITDDGARCRIAIMYESRLIDLERARARHYTHEDQQIDVPGDRGFEYVAGLQDAVISWGPAQQVGPIHLGGNRGFRLAE